MSGVITATVVVGLYSADQQRKAAKKAAKAGTESNDAALEQNKVQFEASLSAENSRHAASLSSENRRHAASLSLQRQIASMSIGEQHRQFSEVQRVLSPYITAGNQALQDLSPYQKAGQDALQGQRALIGMNGKGAQSSAIQGLSNSPEMAAYIQQGENAMLQNAAATGGLRGGNTQAAMGQFRPQLLAGMINQQYSRLGEMTALGANTTGMVFQTGANAAAGQANAGMQVAGNIGGTLSNYASNVGQASNQYGSNIGQASSQYGSNVAGINNANAQAYNQYYNNQGSINSGLALANGQANVGMANSISGALGSYAMLQAMKGGASTNNAGLYSMNTGGGANYNLSNSSGYGLKAF
jgi:hypothetical protein